MHALLLLADAVPPPNVSTSEAIVGAVITLAVPMILKFLRDWWKDEGDRRLAIVNAAARTAFFATEEAKALWPDKVPKALLYAEGKFLEVLATQGLSPSADELARARLNWGAAHGETKVAAKLATLGAPLVLPGPQTPPGT